MQYLKHTYIKKNLSVLYLKFQLNWSFCVFTYVLNLILLVKNPESKIFEDHWCSTPLGITLRKNSESEGDRCLFRVIGNMVTWGKNCGGRRLRQRAL